MTVNGLAVRTGPGPSFPLVAGYRYDVATHSEVLVTNAVRLDDGHYLFVEDGPLVIGGVPWYRVANLPQTGEASEDRGRWDADGDEFLADLGWVAGGDGRSSYLVADEPPAPESPVHGHGPEPLALLSGIGNARSEVVHPASFPVGVRWYAADPEGEACDIAVTLQPVGVDLGTAHVDGWIGGDDWWPRDAITYEDYEGMDGNYWLEIESDCSWSVRFVLIQG